MIYTAGIDVGSTYTKAVILGEDDRVVGRGLLKTGFKLNEAGERALQQALTKPIRSERSGHATTAMAASSSGRATST
jgi:activator of 2-hydroxyglutaryl-CoA dehydratase